MEHTLSIQILRQRYFADSNSKPIFFLQNKISAKNIVNLFKHIEDIRDAIPEDERYNLHYSLCECDDSERARQFTRQNVIAFDIDGIDLPRIEAYIDPILEAIGGIHRSDCGIVASGRGLHFILATDEYWNNPGYFKETRKHYNHICDKIDRRLDKLDLVGHTDRGIWSAGHTLRLPLTKNIKTAEHGFNDDFTGDCTLITRVVNLIPGMSIKTLSGLEDGSMGEVVAVQTKEVGGHYDPDTKGIIKECEFIKWAKDNQEEVREPQWYAMLSVVSRLAGGRELCHTFSDKHPKYNKEETDNKVDQALHASGPRTCANINETWGKCKDCVHNGKITSPILIKTQDFIKTKNTGFRSVKLTKEGIPVPGAIDFEDLRKYFKSKNAYVSTESKMVYVWKGTNWRYLSDTYLEAFCQSHVNPPPNTAACTEFKSLVHRTCVVEEEWFNKSIEYKLNLKNGILDLNTMKLGPHSKKMGFRHTLEYDYDPKATSPIFDKFLIDVTKGRQDLINILLEFAGYAFSNERPKYAKSLILLGEGANGKSTFINVLKELAGNTGFSALSLGDLSNEQMRYHLVGKMFNVAEETPSRKFVDSSVFKDIVTGGTITAKVVYKTPIQFNVKTKLIMAANALPNSADATAGFLRRLLIIPFDAIFYKEKRDIDMDEKLKQELAGILNSVLEGYFRLNTVKRFTDSATVENEILAYREQIDGFYAFYKNHLVVKDLTGDDDNKTSFHDVYQAYKLYCQSNNEKFISRKMMAVRLAKFIPDYKERKIRRTKLQILHLKNIYVVNMQEYKSDFNDF